MSKLNTVVEVGRFLLRRKRYWMIPVVLLLVLLGAILVFAQGSALAPFIYTMF
jgi:hypothetical protein